MRLFLSFLAISVTCFFAYLVWAVQPDRRLLLNLERAIDAAKFSDLESLLDQYGFESETLTYLAIAKRFSRGDGSHPIVFMNTKVKEEFLALCPVECQFTTSEKVEVVPYLGLGRRYKFHSVLTNEGKTEALPDHSLWIMTLP